MKDDFKRALHAEVGNGGLKCNCCKPASKKRHRRRARARMKVALRKRLKSLP